MRAVAVLTTVALLLLAAPSPVRAQTPAGLSASPDQWIAAAALRPVHSAPVDKVARIQASALVRGSRSGRSLGQVLMIVGGAGIVTGLIVDEPIITIAGAGVGGYGLYLYLR